MSNIEGQTNDFRDTLSTLDDQGNRKWMYPWKPKGRFYKYRSLVSYALLILLFAIPFIRVHGDPLLMFNIVERKFIIFGLVLTTQDMHIFAIGMLTLFVFIILFTVVFGRLFCGWVCPQTIFMEMVFRKIEYFIEGDAKAQIKLNEGPMTGGKFFKKTVKHIIFFVIAVLIANVFLMYIIGSDEVLRIVSEPIANNTSGFMAMLIFSAIFYFIFAFFREQVCTNVCPYGRMQGVLLVPDSIVVHYDFIRGEPRGMIRKSKKKNNPVKDLGAPVTAASIAAQVEETVADPTMLAPKEKGDCIDCNMCVKVCPTGIDIRNGTQLECINCTACIDACDAIMDKVKRPRGLIRYDSYKGIKEGRSKIMTARSWGYTGILGILVIALIAVITMRSDMETIILRTPGKLYQKVDDTYLSNLYNYKLINKTTDPIEDIEFKLKNIPGRIKVVGDIVDVEKESTGSGAIFIEIDKNDLDSRKTELIIEVFSKGEIIDVANTNFFGPVK
jgi:polyferredoxin